MEKGLEYKWPMGKSPLWMSTFSGAFTIECPTGAKWVRLFGSHIFNIKDWAFPSFVGKELRTFTYAFAAKEAFVSIAV